MLVHEYDKVSISFNCIRTFSPAVLSETLCTCKKDQ